MAGSAALLLLFQGTGPPPPTIPASVHYACLTAARTKIRSLNLPGVDDDSVVILKIPVDRILGRLKSLGVPLPAVLLVSAPETMQPIGGVCQLDDVGYGVLCIMVTADNQEPTVSANLPQYLLWRQKINRAFRQQRLSGVPQIAISFVEPKPVVDPQGWVANYYVSALMLRFISREPRGINV